MLILILVNQWLNRVLMPRGLPSILLEEQLNFLAMRSSLINEEVGKKS